MRSDDFRGAACRDGEEVEKGNESTELSLGRSGSD